MASFCARASTRFARSLNRSKGPIRERPYSSMGRSEASGVEGSLCARCRASGPDGVRHSLLGLAARSDVPPMRRCARRTPRLITAATMPPVIPPAIAPAIRAASISMTSRVILARPLLHQRPEILDRVAEVFPGVIEGGHDDLHGLVHSLHL